MKTKLTFLFALSWLATSLFAAGYSDMRIYINPGHGGYDSDDRNIKIYPYSQGDQNGFWESKSNLHKGLMLDSLLKAKGATTKMSRTKNTSADDRSLSAIVAEANSFRADFMLSIHTNAGVNNYVLELYSGWDASDTNKYPDANVTEANCLISRAVSTQIAENLFANKITCWGANYAVRGDKTFARTAMGWSNGYGVLRSLAVPGVISEGCMHDYIPETYRLMNMEYKYLETWNFFKTFSNYYAKTAVDHGVIAGSIRDAAKKILFPEFYKIARSRDEQLPIHKAKVTLYRDNATKDLLETYTTDEMYNGVYVFKHVTAGNYIVSVEAKDYYTTEKKVTVTNDKISFLNFDMPLVRNTAPEVISYSPHPASITDSVPCAQDIVLDFNWDMDEASTREAFSITPNVEGTIKFENSQRTMRFVPSLPFEKATHYTVRLSTLASHPDTTQPHHLVEDFVLEFVTKNRNNLTVVTNYPQKNSENIQLKPAFFIVFDAKLTTSGIANHFKVQEEGGAALAPITRNMTNNSLPEPYGSTYFELGQKLKPNTNYKLVIDATLKDVGNIPTMSAIEIPFKTGADDSAIDHPIVMNMDAVAFTFNAEKSRGQKTASAIVASTKYISGKSNQLKYSFEEDEGEVFFTPKNLNIVANNKKTVGFYVFGDFSNNELQAEFSVDGDVKYAKIATLDFAGWKYQEANLKDILPEGIDYQFTGLKVVRKSGILSVSGDLYIDNMMLYETPTGVNNTVLKNVVVYPNPAKEIVHIGWNEAEAPMLTIYSLAGVKMAEAKATNINVTALQEGVYILKAEGSGKTFTTPIAVVK